MNKRDRGILLGMMLGDGSVRGNELVMAHSIKQKEYLEYKSELLLSIFGGKKNKTCYRKTKDGYETYRYGKSDKYIGILSRRLYRNGVKNFSREILDMLNLEGIAIWYMDDGSLIAKYRNGKIHAYDLTLNTYLSKEENEIIIEYFKDIWHVEFKLNKSKGKYRLRMGTREARRFIKLIEPYVIPSMSYKINIRQERPTP